MEIKGVAGLRGEVAERVKEYLDAEEAGFTVVNMGARAFTPANLGPLDVSVACEMTDCDYGSRFVRYFLTPLAMIGPGSCRLEVAVRIVDGQGGGRTLAAKARQAIGFLGGSDEGLMSSNVKIVSKRIAKEVARYVSGRWLLNQTLYEWARWSIYLGLLGIVCGPFASIVGIVLGGIALSGILRRGLSRGKVAAISGLVLSGVSTILFLILVGASGP